MRAKIFCALIACLNSTDIFNNNMILPKGNITRLGNIRGYNGRNDIVPRSNCWVSIAWRGLGVGTILGGLGSIDQHNGNCLGVLIPSLLSVESSYTYWSNKHVGIVGKAILFGDMYYSFANSSYPAVAMLQLGGGVRWSYNGRGGRSNGTYHGGNVMVNLMGGSFTDVSCSDYRTGFYPRHFGVNISAIVFEWVNTKDFWEVGTVFDIEALSAGDWGSLLGACILNIKLSFGKNFYL